MKYVLKLTDMAYDRQDAIDRCYSLGQKFIEHFEKIYKNSKSTTVSHWCTEMQSWLDKVRTIRLRQNNKKLSVLDLMNWFFTIGSTSEVIFKDENISDLYDEFLINIVKYDFNVKEAITNLFKL